MDPAFLLIVGRILIGGAFVVSGVRMFMALPMVSGLLTAKRVPFPFFVAAAGAGFEVVSGALAIAGIWLPTVALLLAAFIVAATAMVHDFWNQPPGPERASNQNAVISNTIIVGALLAIAGLTS